MKCKLAGMGRRGAANCYTKCDADSVWSARRVAEDPNRGYLAADGGVSNRSNAARTQVLASMTACRAVVIALLASCYSPRIQEGAPCSSTGVCPTGQHCVLGSCRLRDPATDAAIDGLDLDAAGDAMPDAMPCPTTGLTCGGTPTMFMCGGHCWVYCPSATDWTTASQRCIDWQGALGEVDDGTEQTCVSSYIMSTRTTVASWIGLSQKPNQAMPGMGWTWNGKLDVKYTHWANGKPDDSDGRENGAEQCGKMETDGQWDDTECTQTNRFLCERP